MRRTRSKTPPQLTQFITESCYCIRKIACPRDNKKRFIQIFVSALLRARAAARTVPEQADYLRTRPTVVAADQRLDRAGLR